MVRDAAVVSWEEGKSKPKTRQLHDAKMGGALGGGFWGLLFGMIFFVPLLGLAIGAAAGALAGSLTDVGISDSFIKQVRDKVTPGTSALFLLSSDAVFDRISGEFADTERRADQHQHVAGAGVAAARGLPAGRLSAPAPPDADGVLAEAAGFAFLAAISPTALRCHGGLPRLRRAAAQRPDVHRGRDHDDGDRGRGRPVHPPGGRAQPAVQARPALRRCGLASGCSRWPLPRCSAGAGGPRLRSRPRPRRPEPGVQAHRPAEPADGLHGRPDPVRAVGHVPRRGAGDRDGRHRPAGDGHRAACRRRVCLLLVWVPLLGYFAAPTRRRTGSGRATTGCARTAGRSPCGRSSSAGSR